MPFILLVSILVVSLLNTLFRHMKKQLRITPRKNYPNSFNMFSSHQFFKNKEELVFEFDEWGCSFRLPSIDDMDRITIYTNGPSCYSCTVYNVELNHGILVFDESESTIDEIFFNYL